MPQSWRRPQHQKQTYALQKAMSASPPIATAKADIRNRSCPLYPRKRTCAVQGGMSALGQKRTHAVQQKGSLFDHLVGEGEHGISRPNAFAVLRLINNSTLVGNATGRSPGLLPFKILST